MNSGNALACLTFLWDQSLKIGFEMMLSKKQRHSRMELECLLRGRLLVSTVLTNR